MHHSTERPNPDSSGTRRPPTISEMLAALVAAEMEQHRALGNPSPVQGKGGRRCPRS